MNSLIVETHSVEAMARRSTCLPVDDAYISLQELVVTPAADVGHEVAAAEPTTKDAVGSGDVAST